MRLAIIDENDRVFVEYEPEVFKQLLINYSKEMSVEEAFTQVVLDLKNLTRRK
ncbi:MAG: hypothetical protein WC444_07230 [Candidatus Paceibacterota bacterium]